MEITREMFDEQRRPRFGNANPEQMDMPFWEWMIRITLIQEPEEEEDTSEETNSFDSDDSNDFAASDFELSEFDSSEYDSSDNFGGEYNSDDDSEGVESSDITESFEDPEFESEHPSDCSDEESGDSPNENVLNQFGMTMRGGVLKSTCGPYHARDYFGVPLNPEDGPIWTFDRMGFTLTELPDGRSIRIGGEHEDHYDPDFCIYNDVVVLTPDGSIKIYGYPKEVFPPTDFHTATLIGNHIIIIGKIGYVNERLPGQTLVHRLDLSTYQISKIETTGPMPGWIYQHSANLEANGTITIRDGLIFDHQDGNQTYRSNFNEYTLDTQSWVWQQLTNRNWKKITLQPKTWPNFDLDRLNFIYEQCHRTELFLPFGITDYVELEEKGTVEFVIRSVPISLTINSHLIEIIMEGKLPDEFENQLIDEIQHNAEAAIECKCIRRQA